MLRDGEGAVNVVACPVHMYYCSTYVRIQQEGSRQICLPISITRSSLFWYTLLLFTEFSAFLTLDSIR